MDCLERGLGRLYQGTKADGWESLLGLRQEQWSAAKSMAADAHHIPIALKIPSCAFKGSGEMATAEANSPIEIRRNMDQASVRA